MTLSPGTQLGPYEILAPLGAGGMGEVYRARDPRLGRELALKVLPEVLALDPGRLARFQQEARAASALNHPNIVTVHEIGRAGDTAFIAMELVDGRTLRELTVSGPMPVKRILNVTAQVAEGLAKAHSAGIVHRDLKPENVMVSKDGFVKILDFGLAKLVEPERGDLSAMPTVAPPETHPGTVMGTVGYMSPEQASGEPLDFRSDQFSLGSIVYEMTTGKKAFQRKTAAETMSAIIREEPEPAARLRPDLPLPVRWILERCLAKDPDERYASTRDLARDLASVRDHISEVSSGAESMLAAPPGKSRRRAVPAAAAVLLVAAALAAGALLARALGGRTPAAPSFRRLTFSGARLANARFAPDGQTIVYGINYQAGPRLFMSRIQSPESKPFEFPGDILAISRSGEMAILQHTSGDGVLATVPMVGGAPRQVVDAVLYAGADWSPDGANIAVVRLADGKTRLEFPIGNLLAEGSFDSPRFSPDGSTISFWEDRDGVAAVVLIDRLGKSKRILSGGWASRAGPPAWAPNGREVWFTAAREGERDALWAVDLSGKLRLTLRIPGVLELDDVASDGRVLLAHHMIRRNLRGLAPGQAKEANLSWLDGSLPADLSPDGMSLLLNEDGEGAGPRPAIYFRGTDGSPALRLSEGRALALSPDKQWVLAILSGGEGKPPSLGLVPTGPGQSRRLEIGNGDARDVVGGGFTPDGARLVFSTMPPDGKGQLQILDIATGKRRVIGPEGAMVQEYSSPVSPDGRSVVGFLKGQAWIFPIDGGEGHAVPGLAPAERVAQWSADSRSLYVYAAWDRPVVISLVDVETGQRRAWKEIPVDESVGQVRLRVTPDGRSYVYGFGVAPSELYLVEGLR
jgi:hypothetical protein